MITVKSFNYEEKKNKAGKVIRPGFHESFYIYNGKTIAWYKGDEDTFYLSTRMLNKDFSKSYFERMKDSEYSEGFNELIDLLKIDENTKLSEFLNL